MTTAENHAMTPLGLTPQTLARADRAVPGRADDRARHDHRERGAAVDPLDVAGALTITTSLMLAVYAIVGGNEAGWTSVRTLALLAAALALLAIFIAIEARMRHPLMPLALFKLRNV
ncbi:MAG: hypothetical protein ACREVZ_16140, partial [Burkholderiales bacterium]